MLVHYVSIDFRELQSSAYLLHLRYRVILNFHSPSAVSPHDERPDRPLPVRLCRKSEDVFAGVGGAMFAIPSRMQFGSV